MGSKSSFEPDPIGGFSLLALYALASGAALCHELIWMKRLALTFGMTLPATATATALFIAGIALGAAVVGRWYRPQWKIPRTFAGLQLFIGLWTLLLPAMFALADSVYMALAPATETWLHHALRVLAAGLILLPPATAMGAIFPLLSSTGVPRLYTIGMASSVGGVLIASLLLLPKIGIGVSLNLLAGVNLCLAALAWKLPSPARAQARIGSEVLDSDTDRAFTAAACLGLALFMAQTVWFQALWLLVDPTAYAQGMVVAAVLTAMTLGGLGSFWKRASLPYVFALTAAAQLALIPLMIDVATVWDQVVKSMAMSGFLAAEFLLALAVVGAPCAGYGMALTLLCRRRAPRVVGWIWASHHAGAVAGALAAAFVLIPAIGVTWTLALAAGLGTAPLWLQKKSAVAGALTLACVLLPWYGDLSFRGAAAGAKAVVFHHEDAGGIVEVYQDRQSGFRVLRSSRLRQEGGTDPEAVRMQRLQGRLTAAVQDSREQVLIVGLGTGISAAALLDERVKTADIVEISAGVIDANRFFRNENHGIANDPRVRMIHQDGRNFIKLAANRYDLIFQDLFFPYRAGVGTLYTREHYLRCRKRLKPGGRVAQWIALAQLGPEDLRILVRTFRGVFPHTSLWLQRGYLLLLGGDQPLDLAPDDPRLRYFLARDTDLEPLIRGAAFNTEDNSLLEYSVPRSFKRLNTVALAMDNLSLLAALPRNYSGPYARAMGYYIEGVLARYQGAAEAALGAFRRAHSLDPAHPLVREYLLAEYDRRKEWLALLEIDPGNLDARYNLGIQHYRQQRYRQAAEAFAQVVGADENAYDALFNLANCWAQLGRLQRAAVLYQRVLERNPGNMDARHNLLEIEKVVLVR